MEESLSPAQRDQVLGLYAETLLTEFRSMVEKTAEDSSSSSSSSDSSQSSDEEEERLRHRHLVQEIDDVSVVCTVYEKMPTFCFR